MSAIIIPFPIRNRLDIRVEAENDGLGWLVLAERSWLGARPLVRRNQ